jgi:flap endonuclease-1
MKATLPSCLSLEMPDRSLSFISMMQMNYMGADLAPLIVQKVTTLEYLSGKHIAIDANNALYQFLSIIRTPDGTSLSHNGKTTSHLVGLLYRTTKLISDYDIRIVYVFDGLPPQIKFAELERRKRVKEKSMSEWAQALREGDIRKAFSKSVMTSRLTREMIDESKQLLDLLGVPWVQAPSEAEAQAAFMARKGVWASGSQDYDSLLFGSPRVVRYVSTEGRYRMRAEKSKPEIIELESVLAYNGITREQLIDISILSGNDFFSGIKGIGPKRALEIVKRYGGVEGLPQDMKDVLPENVSEIKTFFLNPPVSEQYDVSYTRCNEKGLSSFLEERGFSEKAVAIVRERMKRLKRKQGTLEDWI